MQPQPPENPQRILLLEFVNADQFPGRISDLAPLVRGDCLGRGIPTRWIRFGVSTTNLLQHQRDDITLTDEEFATLQRVVDEFRPTRILATDPLYFAQRERLEADGDGPRIEDLSDGYGTRLVAEMHASLFDELRQGRGMWPSYDFEPGNEAARNRQFDNVYLILVDRCGHPRPLAANPLYGQVEDPRVTPHLGCTFCSNWMDRTADGVVAGSQHTDRVAAAMWIDRQFQAIAKSRGTPDRLPNAILLTTLPTPRDFEQCLRSLRESGMAPHVQLLFGVRTDLVPAVARTLRQLYADEPDSPVRTGVYACGVESLYHPDLRRYNKGTSPLDGMRAINTLRELARDFPDRFWHTGLSFLLFTPWSTLESLHLNYGLIRFFGLTRKISGNIFQSRLRLHQSLPITALAEREGLVVEQETDPVLTMNRRKLFAAEQAWRFADPRIRPLSRVVLRYELLRTTFADDLARCVEASVYAADRAWHPGDDATLLDLTTAQVDALLDLDDPPDESTLLELALARLRASAASRASSGLSHDRRLGSLVLPVGDLLGRLAPILGPSTTRVISVHDVDDSELDARVGALLQSQQLVKAIVDSQGRPSRKGKLLVATSAEDLARRVRLEVVLATSTNPDHRAAASLEAGLLHGHPECCSRAYASHPTMSYLSLPWASLTWRAAVDGELPSHCQPLLAPVVGFVPCRADCPAAKARFALLFDELGLSPSGSHDAWLYSLHNTEPCDWVPLSVVSADATSLAYARQTAPQTAGRLAATLSAADTLHFVPGQLQVRAGGRLRALLTGSHAVWYLGRRWHPQEWQELAASCALDRRDAVERVRDGRTATAPESGTSHEGSFDNVKRTPTGSSEVRIVIEDHSGAGACYQFHITPHRPAQPSYMQVGTLTLWYSHEAMTPRADAFARVIAAAMRALNHEPLSAATCVRWRNALARLLSHTGLASQVECSVSWFEGHQ